MGHNFSVMKVREVSVVFQREAATFVHVSAQLYLVTTDVSDPSLLEPTSLLCSRV